MVNRARVGLVVLTLTLATALSFVLGQAAGQSDAAPTGEIGTPPGRATPEMTASPVAVDEVQVVIERFAFNPRRVEITVGTTVVWSNRDRNPHTATDIDDRTFDTGRIDYRGRARHTFTEPGAFTYECFYHKDMTGIVVVRD